MRDWRLWIGILSIGVVLSAGLTQTDTPLINYATLHGEFDYDYFYGNPSVGLVRDGVAEGFRATVPEGFTLELDESDKISGLASQKISFTRNSMQSAEVSLTMDMHFPSDDYPQPGETILITLWLKTENWNNASIRIRARGLNGSGAADLYNSSSALQAWTQLSFNYIVPTSNPRGIALELRVRANAGVASGTVRFDKLEVTGSKRWRNHRPRALKIIAPYYPWAEENQRDWVYYSREFDAIISDWPYIKMLRTHRSELLNVLYYNLIYSIRTSSNTTWGERDIYGYWYADRFYPDWFLLNIYGNRQQFGTPLYLMDIGNPVVSNWGAQNLDLYMWYADSGRDAVHFDSFIDFFSPNFLLQRYPTPASRMAAMHKHLLNMRRVLGDRNIPFIINAAADPYTRDRPHTYFLRQGLLDGMLVEQAFTHIFTLPTGFVPFNLWEQQLNTLIENRPRLRVVYSGYAIRDPIEGRRQKIYALASFLLCADDNNYLYLDKHYYESAPFRQRSWRPDADFDVPLGQPTGDVQVFFRSSDYAGGLYYRPFQNGFVLVNPTGNLRPLFKDGAVFTYILDADYRELWSGQLFPAGSRIKLYPKQARIFYRESSGLRMPGSDDGKRVPESSGRDEKILPSSDPIRRR
jgi:hypothetical protein